MRTTEPSPDNNPSDRRRPDLELSAPLARRLSVRQAAERAGVSTRTVKRWIGSGALPALRLPSPGGRGHLRIALADLEMLLARGVLW